MINSVKLKRKKNDTKTVFAEEKWLKRTAKKEEKKLLYILMSKYNVIGHENKNNIHVLVNVYDSISMLNAPPRGGELARVYVIK